MGRDEDHELFLQTLDFLVSDQEKTLIESAKKRMPGAIVPILRQTGINDREGNAVWHTLVNSSQLDDVVKACRKNNIIAKPFKYDRQSWEAEARELVTLKEQFENKRLHIN